jgi:hypothetical protein
MQRTPLAVLLTSVALIMFSVMTAMTPSVPVRAATSAQTVSTTAAETEIVPVEESMHEFMEYVFQPAYRRLRERMAMAPEDNNGWKAVKSDALILAESCNLLFGRGPDDEATEWAQHASAARTGGAALYKAAKTKDFAATTTAWKTMLENCNACHRQFEDGKHILQP